MQQDIGNELVGEINTTLQPRKRPVRIFCHYNEGQFIHAIRSGMDIANKVNYRMRKTWKEAAM